MKLAGMLRVKNESRWIHSVIESALKVCEHVFVMDDHSTDDTVTQCRELPGVTVFLSPFASLDEARDKNWLLERVLGVRPEWVLAIDGDELLLDHDAIRAAITESKMQCYSLRVLYLWDRHDQVRVDGVYGRFHRPSLFRNRAGITFGATHNGGNFHCGNVPRQFGHSRQLDARLLHFGYMLSADRLRKFYWYNRHDPNNLIEDRYLHMIQGDPGGPPATLELRHAGPLKLALLSDLVASSTAGPPVPTMEVKA